MRPEEVLAVVVSYNSREGIRATVAALRPQVGAVHVVDNGSGAESIAVLEKLALEPGVTVERLDRNFGLGFALNRGIAHAKAGGFAWLLTMDQDSVVEPDMIAAYGRAIAAHPDRVCLSPVISNAARKGAGDDGAVAYAITSGNLVAMRIFNEAGNYDEGLFIDCVDFDFSLRVRRHGFAIHRVSDARMRHQLGEPVALPRFVRRFYAIHSPVRRYYMFRNFLYLAERYTLRFPTFIIKLGVLQLMHVPLVAAFDPRPFESYRAIAAGVRDYFLRRTGARDQGRS